MALCTGEWRDREVEKGGMTDSIGLQVGIEPGCTHTPKEKGNVLTDIAGVVETVEHFVYSEGSQVISKQHKKMISSKTTVLA